MQRVRNAVHNGSSTTTGSGYFASSMRAAARASDWGSTDPAYRRVARSASSCCGQPVSRGPASSWV